MYQMMIAQAIGGGMRGHAQGYLNEASARANNRIREANADNANRVRGASNRFEAAKGALARYMQSVNNNKRLEAGGEALEANLINARRREDALQEQGFEAKIRDSEQVGAQAAAAAFAGVGGEVADMVSASTRLMQQRAALDASRARDYRIYDYSRRAGAIVSQTIRGLDSSLIFDAIDYRKDVAIVEKTISPLLSGILGSLDAGFNLGGSIYEGTKAGKGTTESTYQDDSRSAFRRSEINDRNATFRFDGGGGFGTGADYGNDDYGNYI